MLDYDDKFDDATQDFVSSFEAEKKNFNQRHLQGKPESSEKGWLIGIFTVTLVVISIYSAAIVAEGIISNGNFRIFLQHERLVAWVIASSIQIATVAGLIYISKLLMQSWRDRRLIDLPVSLFILCAVCGFVFFEVSHSVSVQLSGAVSKDLVDAFEGKIANAQAEIVALDEQLRSNYEAHVRYLEGLARDSENGWDSSGTAERGPIWRLRVEKLNKAKAYSYLGQRLPVGLSDASGVAAALALRPQVTSLQSKSGALVKLFRETEGPLPLPIQNSINSLAEDVLSIESKARSLHGVDATNIAADYSFELQKHLLKGKVPEKNRDFFALAYGIAPIAVTCVLALVIAFLRRSSKMSLREAKERVHEARVEAAVAREEFAAASETSFWTRLKNRTYRSR